jgi:hypothetical protein
VMPGICESGLAGRNSRPKAGDAATEIRVAEAVLVPFEQPLAWPERQVMRPIANRPAALVDEHRARLSCGALGRKSCRREKKTRGPIAELRLVTDLLEAAAEKPVRVEVFVNRRAISKRHCPT